MGGVTGIAKTELRAVIERIHSRTVHQRKHPDWCPCGLCDAVRLAKALKIDLGLEPPENAVVDE